MRRSREGRHPASPQTARLPRLRKDVAKPNINRRAQDIIAAHMYERPSEVSLTGNMPLLQQIESSAPRTARTHDISHLQDRGSSLRPAIPPTMVSKSDHIYEQSFLPKDSSSVYNDADGLWHTLVFPSDTPSSRKDAVHLDEWIARSLCKRQEAAVASASVTQSVEDLVPVLSIALHEIVRQVTHHCVERGLALQRIWQTYVELFNRVLQQMQELLNGQTRKTAEVQRYLTTAREEMQGLRKYHPEEMHRVIGDLEDKFTKEQKELEDKLKRAQDESAKLKHDLRARHKELEAWYPNFSLYQESPIRNHFALMGRVTGQKKTLIHLADDEDISPDMAIAEDFKRLLSVLTPEKRKIIGQELSSILNMPNPAERRSVFVKQQVSDDSPEAGWEDERAAGEGGAAMAALREEVRGQEERIRGLRREIVAMESEGSASPRRARRSLAKGKSHSFGGLQGQEPAPGGDDDEGGDDNDDDDGSEVSSLHETQQVPSTTAQRRSALMAAEVLAGSAFDASLGSPNANGIATASPSQAFIGAGGASPSHAATVDLLSLPLANKRDHRTILKKPGSGSSARLSVAHTNGREDSS